MPGDRYGLRERLRDSLDEIYAEKYDRVIDSCESKVFGIGLESMTVGSNEFYLAYAATHPGVYDLLDLGHFHPTENVADKLSALRQCIEERKAGNREFLSAEEQTRRAIEEMHLPEADWFMKHCLGAFEKNLDELGTM